MRKKLTGLAAAVVLNLSMIAGFAYADQTGTVHGGWLQLRESPSFQGRVLASYPTGTVVTIVSESGSWYGVKAPDGMQGYMLGRYLTVNGGSGTLPPDSTGYVTSTNGLNVRMRSGPGTNYSVMASYAPGTACKVLSAEKGWYQIQIGSYTGFMMTKFVTGTPPSGGGGIIPPTTTVWVSSANGRSVNLRSGAGKNYASIGLYPVGATGKILQAGKTWSYVQFGTRTGYMMTQFLTTKKPDYPLPSGTYVISANGRNVNLRYGPGTGYNAVAAFPPGTPLTILNRGGEWHYIQIQGYYGYMMSKFIHE